MVSPRLLGTALVLLLLLAGLATWLTRRNRGYAAESTPKVTTVVAEAKTGEEEANTKPSPTFEVEMTAYTSVASQTDATPNLTASGAEAGPGTAAASRDLLERLPYGSQVEVVAVSGEGCSGWVPETPLTVADTMNARTKNHLDVWLATEEQARNWGRCHAVVRVSE